MTSPRTARWPWARLLRVHQWPKNLLVLVSPLAAHRLDVAVLGPALVATLAFSLCASAGYVVNDVLDADADRAHATKRRRPIAAGEISPRTAFAAAALAAVAAIALGAGVGLRFLGALAVYGGASVAYSAWLKRIAILDVLVLAGLYTLRILAGTLATGVPTSSWLFTLAIFLFLSLALVKRTSELVRVERNPLPDPLPLREREKSEGNPLLDRLPARLELRMTRRGYAPSDLEILSALGVASGLIAVLVLALYVSSADVTRLYRHPERLWLLCPLALHWVSRIWLLARRGVVDEDPVLFALRDRASWVTGGIAAAVVVAGT
jgi:4-hydroxybenzoate polyprenyltransferase